MLVARNSVILLVGQVLGQAITLVLGIAITRVLGATEYGRYVSAFAFATVFVSFTSVGLEGLLIREIARRPTEASKLFRDASLIRFVLSLSVYLLMIGATFILGFTTEQREVALLAGLVTEMTSLADFVRAVFRAFERMEFDTLSRLVERGAAAILIMAVLLRWHKAGAVAIALMLANLIALGTALFLADRFVRFEGNPSWNAGFALLRMAVPFGITSIVVGVITRLDSFFLSLYRPANEVGWYGAAMNLVWPLSILPQAFSSSLFPRLSKLAVEDLELARAIASFSLKWTLLTAFPIAAILSGLAEVLVLALFGTSYASSVLPLRLLAIGLVLIYVNTIASNILGAFGRQDIVAAVVTGDLVLTVVLCLGLIPKFGIAGAALAIVSRDLFGFLTMLWALYRNGWALPKHSLKGAFASGMVLFGGMYCLRAVNPLYALVAALLVYAVALVVTQSVGPRDWWLMRQVLLIWRESRRRLAP